MLACNEAAITATGEFGRPIPLLPGGPLEVPRVAWTAAPNSCGGGAVCSDICEAAPHECRADQCSALVVDTGSPFSYLSTTGPKPQIGRECLEIRAAPASGMSTGNASVRFRFEDVPAVRVPAGSETSTTWLTRVIEPGPVSGPALGSYASGVLGGTFAASFTLRFIDRGEDARTLTVYRNYPSVSQRPGGRAPANIQPQYPGRLLGQERGDDCRFGDDEDCRLPGTVDSDVEETPINSPSMLVADGCVAPPACRVVHRPEQTSNNLLGACGLQTASDDPTACSMVGGEGWAGGAASFLVATGVPGMILFGDSVRRWFGSLAEIPVCSEAGRLDVGVQVCRSPETTDLPLTGWAHLRGLVTLQLSGIALVSGAENSEARTPCQRLNDRMTASLRSCEEYLRTGTPGGAIDEDEIDEEDSRRDRVGFVWLNDTTARLDDAASSRSITAIVLPETTSYAWSLRQLTGSAAIELDGVIGTTLLQGTDVVFDYGESDVDPGLRVSCTDESEASGCMTAAACVRDEQGSSESCCQGLPRSMIADLVERRHSGFDPLVPSGDDECCAVLSDAQLLDIRGTYPRACPDVRLEAGVSEY